MARKAPTPASTGADDVNAQPAELAATEMTAAQAAALVKREAPELDKDGKPTGKTTRIAVSADEVFAFRDYGDRVVVVTVDGHKLEGAK